MSKDIRSFFKVLPKKPSSSSASAPAQKRVKPIHSSDDDDVVAATPPPTEKKRETKQKKRKAQVISSDSEEEFLKDKAKSTSTIEAALLQPVNALDVLGNEPVKQAKVQQIEKPEGNKTKPKQKKIKKVDTELGVHDDPDFEKCLLNLDEEVFMNEELNRTIDEALTAENNKTQNRKRKHSEHEDSGTDKDQERYEKRRNSAILYQKYLHRSGPPNHGKKELPEGKPDCLSGLCFLKTGVLDSLDSNEFEDIIKRHGGRVVHAVSKKVTYVVAGEDPGPAKLEKAHNAHIKVIKEDDLLDLILIKSGMRPKYATNIKEEEKGTPTKEDPSVKPDLKKLTSNVKSTVEVKNKVTKSPRNDKLILTKTEHPKIIAGKDLAPINRPSVLAPTDNLAWTEKYKPMNTKALIGQQGDKSNMKKLLFWLQNWHTNHTGKGKPKLVRPSPWAKNDDGAYFKCALLSGPPGVGKTSTATLVAKELGFDVVEFNASDTRSKKMLNEEVSQLLKSTSIASYVRDGSAPSSKHVLLMDEVDGMAGNEDRGGVQELIALVKNSNVPVICMCNDRTHPKIRSLANYCLDLRFCRPRLEQIRGAMMSVCCREGLKISSEALSKVITGAGMDIRQTLNHLSMWTALEKELSPEVAQKEAKTAQKDTILGPWEVVRKVFSEEEHRNMSLSDKSKLFFYDYSLGPLFVQENYLQVVPHCPKSQLLQNFADAADCLSESVIIENKIRSSNNWSLLEVQGMFASVLPGHHLKGHVGGQINFPSWLGKNSKRGKFIRLVSELQKHMRLSACASRNAVNLDYIYHLRDKIINPLVKDGASGVEKSLDVMRAYNLLREDFDSLVELAQWPRRKDPLSMVDSKVKAAFTRAYNKDNCKLPYAISSAAVKKKTAASQEDELFGNDDEMESSVEDDDDVEKDGMIKAKKKVTAKGKEVTAGNSKKPEGKGKKTKAKKC